MLAFKNNVAKFGKPNQKTKKNKNLNYINRILHDQCKIKDYNCQNLGHYASIYPETSKN